MAATSAFIGLLAALGAAALLYTFANETTGRVFNAVVTIRRIIFGVFSLLFGISLLLTGVTALVFVGAVILFMAALYVLYDDSFSGVRSTI